jgi:hypothetical protein
MMTAVLLAVLLSQTASTEPPPEAGTPPARSTPTLAPPQSPLPVMSYGETTWCVTLQPSAQVPSGGYRVQCDDKTRRCLAAPEHELDVDGTESDRFLERITPCTANPSRLRMYMSGDYTFEPAIAEAPDGWYRDERGRVMQFNFDLHRRVWLGGAWAPLWRQDEGRTFSRGRVDFGIITEFPSDEANRMHRIAVLDTELMLGQQSSIDFTLLRYDTNMRPENPLLRVTTFVGKPRRFDFSFDMGTWLEVLRLEQLRRSGTEALFYTFVTGHLTLDLWHSRDLTSYVRVRAGPSVEYDRSNHFFTLVPGAVLEGDFTLDANGFHHLTFGAEAEKIYLGEAVEGRPQDPERLRVRAGYELILLAFNDQPLSLVVDGRGQWRNDIPDVPNVWEWSVQTGLRFSLWAPPRRSAPAAASR